MGKSAVVLQESLFREVLSAVTEAEMAGSVDDLHSTFRPVFRLLGFSLYAGIEILNPRSDPSVRALFGEGYEPWLTHYQSMGYAKGDPIVRECIQARDPFFWSDVLERSGSWPEAQQIMYDAGVHGFTEGFMAPLQKTERSVTVVMLAGSGCYNRGHHTRASAYLLSTSYGMLGQRLMETERPRPGGGVSLTERQLECLKWAREGKSSTDIGAILGISVDVVDEHIARACKRLGVRTRMQAVVAAVLKGYLEP